METPPQRSGNGHDTDWLREQIIVLTAGCPHTKSNPPACPLHEVRKLEPAAIVAWMDGLNSNEKEFLMMYHQCCLVINRERDADRQVPKLGSKTTKTRNI